MPGSLAVAEACSGSSFDVEFVDETGSVLRSPLSVSWAVPLGFESWAERDVVMMLDFDSQVVGLSSQPFWLHWQDGGHRRRHAPDF
jgi:hypothetical protein